MPLPSSLQKIRGLDFFLVFSLTFLLYGQTLFYDFVWDDYVLIVNTDALRRWDNFYQFLTVPFFKLAKEFNAPYHRPVIPILLSTISSFSGLNPFGYHFANILLKAAGMCLFLRLLKTMPIPKSAVYLSAAIALVHPIHVEVVAWPSCIPILFAAVLFLLGLLESQKKMDRLIQPAALWGIYALGLLTYDLFVTLPLLIILRDFIFKIEKSRKGKWLEYGGYLILTGAWFLMRLYFVKTMGGMKSFEINDSNATNIVFSGSSLELWLGPVNVVTRYLELFFFPFNLTPEVYFQAAEVSFSALACVLLFLLMSGFMWKRGVKVSLLIFSIGWMALGILPLVRLIRQGGLFADRYLFFPSMGFSLWLGLFMSSFYLWLKEKVPHKKSYSWLFLGLILTGFTVKTLEYSRIWRDEMRLWVATVSLTPKKPRVYYQLGMTFLRFGHPVEAEQAFRHGLTLTTFDPRMKQGLYYSLKEQNREAEAQIVQAEVEELLKRPRAS